MNISNLFSGLLILCIFFNLNKAQSQAEKWYVGNNIAIDFSSGDPVVGNGINLGHGDLTESSTAITDANGDLLFAVGGDKVYDGGENPVHSLPSYTWDVSNGTMIVPVPGTTNEYYLTVLRSGGQSASAPMAQYYQVVVSGTGSGNLTLTGPNDLVTNLTESQASVPKINQDGTVSDEYWWVSHEKCNNNFVVYAVADSGISLSSKYAAGPNFVCSAGFPPRYDVTGTMKFNSCYTKLAYVIYDKVMLYDFDPVTGQITYINSVESSDLNQAYSAEFSPDGNYLYICNGMENNNPGEIFRSEISSSGLGTPVLMGATGGMRGGHLQLAPDGNIYYAIPEAFGYEGKGKIGRITFPDSGGVMDNNWYEATAASFFSSSSDEDQWVNMDMPIFMKGFVVSKPKLLLNGTDWSKSQICVGEYVNFEIEVQGSVASSVDWTAVGVNAGTQTGGSSYNKTMTNVGTTIITAKVIDECGREKEVEFDVITHEIQKPIATIDYTACPNPILTGSGALTDNYKWYDADPNSSSANLIGLGKTFTAKENTIYWISPAGNMISSSANDSRTPGNWSIATGNTTVIVADGVATLNQFKIGFGTGYATSPWVGDFTVTLKNSSGSVVGTPVTINVSAAPFVETIITGNSTDWVMPAGSYTIEVAKPSWATIRQLSEQNSSSGSLSFNGGQVSSIKTKHYVEDNPVLCFVPSEIEVWSCCTAPTDDPSIDVSTSMLEVCSPNTGKIVSTSGLTNGLDYRWEVSSNGLSDWQTYVGTGDSGDITGGQATLNSVAVDQWYRLVVALDGNLNKTCVKISDSVQMVINPLPVIDSIGKNPYSSIYCKDEIYEVEAHLDELEGYPVTYQWSKDAFGTDSVFIGITTPGTHTYKVVVNAGNCLDSMEIQVYVAPSDSLIMNDEGDFLTCSNLTSSKSETEFDDFLEFDIIDANGRLIKTGERGDWVPFYYKKKGLYFVRFKFNDGAIRIKKIISY